MKKKIHTEGLELVLEEKKKEVKAKRKGKVVYFRILDDNYALLEKISNENNLTVNKYVQKIVMEKIETAK
ncbi:hypothetical protein OFQ45_14240 [Brachyspira hyodysenteriae]|uniref:hypothetical protein n=1 Tax=Brachyspira hyodysenteriae TaxID=159 RepID=UPI0022CD7BDE|nr:hypothetical protein [Brachyspira hyodysenteriae]MCZ9918089.1 hypothetical protein [Brachyspira hyodysenteriae]